ncbi:hypothetical protein GCM10007972_04780 [Iodidimonas muriae]|uniref:Uncharacterized protein n=1 Tax=Iodidimonas muriae TaxID=261467 RepID=A0ABQ2L9D3_9PROT|nr:hypothetical protein [Iodidimonas muriae]GER08193.1 hypothetical protein JCM17843_25030 [Kordiimonadales bacterium JCM 17843]GGO06417.1 hypothetical protein GCM10007972_04780 [Iodidimonas muriae]
MHEALRDFTASVAALEGASSPFQAAPLAKKALRQAVAVMRAYEAEISALRDRMEGRG